jgi:hypothetical protein
MCQLETERIILRIDPAKEPRSLPGWRSMKRFGAGPVRIFPFFEIC